MKFFEANPLKLSLRKAIFSIIAIIAFLFVGVNSSTFYFLINSQSKKLSETSDHAVEQIVSDGKSLLENSAIQLLTEKAKDISSQIKMLPANVDSSVLQKVGVQKIGKTGYSCVYECITARMLAHPNKSLIGRNLRSLKLALPSWWAVFEPSLTCKPSKGYYDWKDADGNVRKKYMVMYPVEGSRLMVAATSYLDEFTKPMFNIENEGHEKLSHSRGVFEAVTLKSYWVIFGATLVFLTLMFFVGTWSADSLMKGLGKIRAFAYELSLGNYDAHFGLPPRLAELQDIFSSLEKMRDQILSYQKSRTAEASLAAAARLSKQIAHDLRSPLSALMIGIQHFRRHMDRFETEDKEVVQILESVSQRLHEMIDTVLKPKANFLHNIEKFDCAELVGNLVNEFERKYTKSERDIHFEMLSKPDKPVLVIGSKMNIARVFSNILQNGAEALVAGGLVKAEVSSNETQCSIKISDNGVGIPKHYIHDIFKEGFTLGKRGGTGLGLSLCQQVISEHGGDIQVVSEVGRGTELLVTFPLPVESAYSASDAQSKYALPIKEGKRLLVVDDSILMLSKWFRTAIKHGVEGDYFNSFEEAKEAVNWENFEKIYGLVIVDYLIPQSAYNGIAICEEIRSLSKDMQIAISTSDFMNEALKSYSDAHSIQILPKAYFEELRFTFTRNT